MLDTADQHTAPARRHLGAQLRIAGADLPYRLQQQRIAQGLGHAQAQQPGRRGIARHPFAQGVHLAQDGAAVAVDLLTQTGWLERLGVAVEQLDTQILFQALQPAGDGRLSEPKGQGSGIEGAAAEHRDKGFDIVGLHEEASDFPWLDMRLKHNAAPLACFGFSVAPANG